MKRFHVNLAVADLDKSIDFYTTLFGQAPSVHKDEYAKWMLEDPRINFAISQSSRSSGINHIGLQAESMPELGEIQERLYAAGEQTFEQPAAECCYASSSKTWVRDPDQVAWETFVTHGQNTHYGSDGVPESDETRCCA
ncbi:MAG: ArsI/CadI family heavy metal resistance metalloenzyme [Woeseiaceae bacterium]